VVPFIENCPFSDRMRRLEVRGTSVSIYPYYLVVWVSVTPQGLSALPGDTPMFTAAVDTAHSHNFSIKELRLREWGGLELRQLRRRPRGVKVIDSRGVSESHPLYDADLWLHSNLPGIAPLRVELDRGITVYEDLAPQAEAASRLSFLARYFRPFWSGSGMAEPKELRVPIGLPLPLLGARALRTAELQVLINYKNLTFSIGNS
jgi:hypothetical protein